MVTTTDRDKCSKFIQKISKARLTKVKERQVRKLNSLINKTSNNNNKGNNSQMQGSENNNNQIGNYNNSKLVIKLSKTTSTKGQESLLAKGPNLQ